MMAADSVFAQAMTANMQTGCVMAYDATIDYFPEKIDAVNLTNLAYTYSKNYKTITNKFSNETIVLYQCGTPKPTVPGATQTISVPIQNMTVGDTTLVTYLELLNQRQAIKFTTSGTLSFISSPCIQQMAAANQIIESDSKNQSHQIQQIESTAVFFNYFDPLAANVSNAVTFPASADPGLKGRAEWIGFLASFFNQESLSNTISASLGKNVGQLSTAANAATSAKPVVAWIEYQAPYSAAYPAAWIINARQYEIDYTTNAGATLFLPATTVGALVTGASKQATAYSYNTSTALLAALTAVDIIIDESFYDVNSTDFVTSFLVPTTSNLKFIQNKQVYMFNKEISGTNGGNEFFEAGIVEENVMLADLISVTHPEVVGGATYVPTFLRNIFSQQQVVLTAKGCVDASKALVLPVVTPVAKSGAGMGVVVSGLVAVMAALFA
ncbi:hypothetical protein HDU98_006718 [Podochytrium sp. JEL0797]|nr:hypothetical protein HDU98_006718 [Podochytrium sp. JEL0797]